MTKYEERLFVSWKGPRSGAGYFVGSLIKQEVKQETLYTFRYNHEFVKEAEQEGFIPFVGLNKLDEQYVSKKLFPIFERRLPNQSRNIFKKFIVSNGLQQSDAVAWEYLKITKGRTATDSLSFLEPVYVHNGCLSYTGEVAGWSFTRNENKHLNVNDEVILRIDVNNEQDPKAIEIIDPVHSFTRVGYIQKPINTVFFDLLNNGHELTKLTGRIKMFDPYDGRPIITVEKPITAKAIKESSLPYVLTSV